MALNLDDWAWLYIGVSAITLITVRNSSVHLHAATALLFWQVFGMTVYHYNEIETVGRSLAAILFTLMSIVLYKVHRRSLFLLFILLGAAAVGWSLLYNVDPYTFKAGLNGIWLTGVISTWISFCLALRLLSRLSG